jgi:hypothetical protein
MSFLEKESGDLYESGWLTDKSYLPEKRLRRLDKRNKYADAGV